MSDIASSSSKRTLSDGVFSTPKPKKKKTRYWKGVFTIFEFTNISLYYYMESGKTSDVLISSPTIQSVVLFVCKIFYIFVN